jgi:hypothetical protein
MSEIVIPKGTEYTLVVPIKRDASEKLTFYMRDIDEAVYSGAKSLIDQKKELAAVRMIIQQLMLPGSDAIDKLNFIGLQAASAKIVELITPMDADLKKN